ncbi:TATA-binding protein-associated factor 172-like [Ruditapes philippinarum]|uniref:TATA-binding protein-associated factor 172-like n=1 Tax=Ruditapes philippinarum TaxID=129788 RepID=UPI00295C091E|nr:TATA-binding protein-associated factor 172-like [Ruditapes philippinarum]
MTTRLDRLFLLLDTGSTALIRKSAAEQLGDVQKLHPYELNNLLTKVLVYLRSSNWDTRIAAAQAVNAIARNVPQWEPRGAPKQECGEDIPGAEGKLLFSKFDLQCVLQNGTSLLGSEGVQFNQDDKLTGIDERERLLIQRQMLNKRLGLDVAGNLQLDIDKDLYSDEDLLTGMNKETAFKQELKHVGDLVNQQIGSSLSSRERNRAKRKARMMIKRPSRESPLPDSENEPPVKKMKSENGSENTGIISDLTEEEDWPFDCFCELLMADLFHTAWETRHGAATGLREVIKLHGRGAGKSQDTPADQMSAVNQIWLSDLALRLLSVIALDRFGDYVSDEVVAPVRETCAQTLGVVIKFLEADGIQGVLCILLQLLTQKQWEVRHGGLLGMKYLLAVRKDMTGDLLPKVLPFIYQGLQDADDDNRAVAASALIPVADDLVQILPQQVPVIVLCLWETLLDLDDLTASTNSIMTLLSALVAHPKANVIDVTEKPLTELVPRLLPFFRHNIPSVRTATMKTLHTLLTMQSTKQSVDNWLPNLLQPLLCHVYQRSLLETHPEILSVITEVWNCMLHRSPPEYLVVAATPWMGVWLSLAMQPSKIPYDHNYLVEAKHPGRISFVMRKGNTAAQLLGCLCSKITQPIQGLPDNCEKPSESLDKLLVFHLNTKSAIQRIVIAEVVHAWAATKSCECSTDIKSKLLETLTEGIYYDEIALGFTRLQTECRDFIASLKQQGINMDQIIAPGTKLCFSIKTCFSMIYLTRVQSSLAKAVVSLDAIPEKLNPVIRPLMDCIKKEENIYIQRDGGKCVSGLLRKCLSRDPCPNNKVIKNLCAFLCCDPSVTPVCTQTNNNSTSEASCDMYKENLTLAKLNKIPDTDKKRLQRSSSVKNDVTVSPDLLKDEEQVYFNYLHLSHTCATFATPLKWYCVAMHIFWRDAIQSKQLLSIQRRGGEITLNILTSDFNDKLPQELPSLWETATKYLLENQDSVADMTDLVAQETVNCLQVVESIVPSIHSSLLTKFVDSLPCLQCYLQNKYSGVRHMSARCVGMLSRLSTADVMLFLIEKVLPMFEASDNDVQRQGASEAIANVIEKLNMDIIPYIVLLIVPVLGRMTDQHEHVRTVATHCFASLIRLLPLESGVTNPPDMKSSLVERKVKERAFLEQLLDGTKIENYKVDVPIKAELRKYQQDGVNWLGFLNKYKLHGILCDDMGLGKTLQSICIIATDHYRREQKYKESENPDCKPLPSIVVCPPTLIGHWVYEVNKFIDKEYLNPLMYAGPPVERLKLQKKAKKYNMIVASYDVVRNDIEFFSSFSWNYCVLDEGHIIKNGKTKISKAVKQLNCNHRLILSGTPIQNNVLDLWSLFDFLVPGFLGTERQFQARYGKPILASREAKSSSKEQEAGALAMETLHRQVLPFILRRLKEDVLKDLPPKIIQDYYCDLSQLQVKLYEDFSKSQAQKGIEDCVTSTKVVEPKKGSTHVFQALQYLRKVCNHPALVLNTGHPKYTEVMGMLKTQGSNLHDISHAPKLTALKQLLLDCGIGVEESAGQPGTNTPVVNQHRVLLFCQLKGMLDIVEKDLLKVQMPSVTFLRLDGTVPAGSRHDIVNRFNNDPSIDILLLTTHVGGLGLNLTGADTVIFVEHDWNPMKDLQAMDRAHRIGQKKVVNVYRLITRGTLEEKIMGLQKFKLTIANTVISQDNASLNTMGTDQLLDLFTLEDKKKGESSAPSDSKISEKKETVKSILEGLGDLWEDDQYQSEYDMKNFMKSLV